MQQEHVEGGGLKQEKEETVVGVVVAPEKKVRKKRAVKEKPADAQDVVKKVRKPRKKKGE